MAQDLGQHLLCDDRVIARVVKAAALKPGDHVLDAGAGKGALTRPIANAVAPGGVVWAVDLDPAMIASLSAEEIPGVTVIEDDLVAWPFPESLTAVVANPPFKIAAHLIERVAVAKIPRGVFVVPRELADRLSAKPGTEHYGKLSVRLGLRVVVQDLGFLPRRAFNPPPEIVSGIIRMRTRTDAPEWDAVMLEEVLDAAWSAWDRKARHALAPLATKFRTDSAALTKLLTDSGWGDLKASELSPDAYAAISVHFAKRMA